MKITRHNFTNLLIFTSLVLWTIPVTGQVTIGSSLEPKNGALLDLKEDADGTSKKGLGMPQVRLINRKIPTGESLAQTIAGNATDENWDKDEHIGLIIYNINSVEISTNRICPGIHVWDGEEWLPFIPYAAPLERIDLDITGNFIRSFQYLESDPNHPNFDINLWPADKQDAARSEGYKLGPTTKVYDRENNDYYTSRFYVGYKLLRGMHNVQRSYKCDPSAAPNWVNTGETTYETTKIFTDGIWTTESMRTKTMPNGNAINYTNASSTTEPRYQYPGGVASNLTTARRGMGLMYNWAAATGMQNSSGGNQGGSNQYDIQIQGICPQGWYLPSDQDWTDLENGIILKTAIFSTISNISSDPMSIYDSENFRGTHGRAMKSQSSLGQATNGLSKSAQTGGFDAWLAGNFAGSGASSSQYWNQAFFWSASRTANANNAWIRHLAWDNAATSRIPKQIDALINVRCIKTTAND